MNGSDQWRPIGVITGLYRYPLKGCQGEALHEVRIGWHGLTHDRGFALHRTQDLSGLPWASPRQFPQLLAWTASIPAGSSSLAVSTPGGDWLTDPRDHAQRVAFSAHATDVLGEPMTLMNLWSGTHDSMPISIITTETITAAAELIGSDRELDTRRFRPNVLLHTTSGRPWPERQWLGREIRLGDPPDAAVLRIDRHTTRCEALDHDPESGAPLGDRLFEAIRRGNHNRAGVYATPRHVGCAVLGRTAWTR
jgi:uncharacterized protein YcbX